MLFSTWRAWEKEGEEAFRGVRKRGLALFVFWGAKKRQYFGLGFTKPPAPTGTHPGRTFRTLAKTRAQTHSMRRSPAA